MKARSRLLFLAVVIVLVVAGLPAQQSTPDDDFTRGQAALRAGKYHDAVDAFKKAEKRAHDACPDCFLGLAIAYFRLGDRDGALKNSDKLLSSATDDARRGAAHNLKGQSWLQINPDSKSFPKAEAEFREAIKVSPGSADFHLSLAQALLKQSKDEEAISELNQCIALHPDAATTETAKKLIANPKRGREEFAPEFELTTLQGDQISLKELSGKMVVLDFWATWCPPCRASVPELKTLTKKYPNDRLVLISISGDQDEGAWREFVSKHDMTWSQTRDSNRKLGETFNVHAFPTYLVIGVDGAIRARIVGMNPQESIVHRLKDVLASTAELSAKN
jgi:thioredoxin-like negative regulator of GroEL